MMDYRALKKRYVGLDILRIVSALVICMFHTTIHLGCDYGPLQSLSIMGAVFMTLFFMLSGFSLFVNWAGTELNSINALKSFWKKRLFGIMPMYWLVSLVFVIVSIVLHEDTVARALELAPIEAFGLQSVFSSLFGFSHNGGTWFVSCILICYAAFPFVQELIKSIGRKGRLWFWAFCVFVLLYSPIVVYLFKTNDIYSNPFFRLLEFIVGMLLAAIKLDFDGSRFVRKFLYNWWTIIFVDLAMIFGISLAVRNNIEVGNFTLYGLITIPCFMMILFGISGVESDALSKSKLLKKLSAMTYVFFLAQLFSNKISRDIIEKRGIEGNATKIIIGWAVCFAIAACLRFFEIKINRHLRNKAK